MKKIVLLLLICTSFFYTKAQDNSEKSNSHLKKSFNLNNRPGDHFMLQLTGDGWSGMPDSIKSHKKGFSRGVGFYFMFDKVFKTSPQFSLGIGVGASSSSIFFNKMEVDLKSKTEKLPFLAVDSTNHFKKYKMATSYLEVPLEFRYTSNPENYNKSWKAAIGLKIGTLVNAHTKGKTMLDKNDSPIGSYTQKINSKTYINGTRFAVTVRVGYGIISLYGSYGLSNILKDGVGPEMKPFQVGIAISGL
ncbi:MAG TPA: outer membrane beta-barrel protein [Ginsengibacter sp.]|nr:outer membrane beta-barrel protein [Ginsengibacter sp.]HRP16673.1 outer membrane beta-barrel protein [Ginsengibacter sp.]HRP43702.1 outer membrane beta-barrel protein [Ginsengibacter sp.]